jgi:IclR family transcriptional regulator, acetate operon repressor
MDVKTAGRTVDLFEAFAKLRRPASLSELAAAIGMPLSSCSNLVRTIQARGYLYMLRDRGPFYPTARLLEVARVIAANDPILLRVGEHLTALSEASGETVVIGTIRGKEVLYIDVVESKQAIRYSTRPGTMRPVHANSIGKAVLSRMDSLTRADLLKKLSYKRLTPKTILSAEELEVDLRAATRRGWFGNAKESVEDLAAVAMPVTINGGTFGISIAGPVNRVQAAIDDHVAALKRTCAKINDA